MELLVALSIVAVFGTVITTWAVQSRRSKPIGQCVLNLKELSLAMTLYAHENSDRLPFAFIQFDERESITWDTLIFPYLDRKGSSRFSSRSLDRKHELLLCPADRISGQGRLRRTYAMSRHDMDATNWPPSAGNTTGVGLWWSDTGAGKAALNNVLSPSREMAVRLEMISAPAGTLLATEQARADNLLFDYHGAALGAANQQFLDWNSTREDPYHHGKFNYLMTDGHVETLRPRQKPGIWTIRSDD